MKAMTAGTLLVLTALAATTAGCGHGRALVDEARAGDAPAAAIEIPLNTDIVGSLDQALDTETNLAGEAFALTTTEVLVIDGHVMLDAGAVITGELCDVRARGRSFGAARMTLSFRNLTAVDGRAYALTAEAVTLRAAGRAGAKNPNTADVELVRISTDGVIGPGLGQGSVVVLAGPGQDVRLEAGRKLRVRLTSPIHTPKGP